MGHVRGNFYDLSRPSWCWIRIGPQDGWPLRKVTIRPSTLGSIWCGQALGRCERSASVGRPPSS